MSPEFINLLNDLIIPAIIAIVATLGGLSRNNARLKKILKADSEIKDAEIQGKIDHTDALIKAIGKSSEITLEMVKQQGENQRLMSLLIDRAGATTKAVTEQSDTISDLDASLKVLLGEGSLPVQRIDAATQTLLKEGSAPAQRILEGIQTMQATLKEMAPLLIILPGQNTEIKQLLSQIVGFTEQLALKATHEMSVVKVEAVEKSPERVSPVEKEN